LPPFSIAANDKLRFVALMIGAVVAARLADRIRGSVRLAVGPSLVGSAVAAAYAYLKHPSLTRAADWLLPLIAVAAAMMIVAIPVRAARIALIAVVIELFVLNAGFNALVSERYYKPRLPI